MNASIQQRHHAQIIGWSGFFIACAEQIQHEALNAPRSSRLGQRGIALLCQPQREKGHQKNNQTRSQRRRNNGAAIARDKFAAR